MIFIYEDFPERFGPLSLLRPVSEIRCGALTFRQKLARLVGQDPQVIIREDIVDLVSEQWPELAGQVNNVPQGRHLFLVAGVAGVTGAVLTELVDCGDKDILFVDNAGEVIGFSTDKLAGKVTPETIKQHLAASKSDKKQIPARLIHYPWEIFSSLELEVTRDFEGVLNQGELDPHCTLYGENLRLEPEACVQAGTVIDTRKGPVTICQNALLKGPNLIEGPCYIGSGTIVDSARIRPGTVLGPVCRVGGEVEASIFHGYVNKHHDGFMGHAYLGEWVNLGAMTTNSDLKNNYSEIKVILDGETLSTGLTKFGCIIGDHTKTAIGTLIPTGAIIGIFANLLGGGLSSKDVPSFSWGESGRYQLDRLISTSRKVMERREITMGEALRARIQHLHNLIPDNGS